VETRAAAERALSAVFRQELPKLIGALARWLRDVGRAEEIAQEALLIALEKWPEAGVPENPGAWLMATAKHRAFNELRRGQMSARKHEELGREADAELGAEQSEQQLLERLDDDVGDDLLRLVFIACHPVLATEARVALTLRLLGGLSTAEIARAFLLPEPTIAQRIVRAKRTLAEQHVPFEVPHGSELSPRLGSVLEVVYLIFNEGYSASAGDDWLRPALCEEALRLAALLAALAPSESEAHGLLALLELNASRLLARTDARGEHVLLLDQDRSRWDAARIARGLAALARGEALGGAGEPYALQAAISACHARAAVAAETDWQRIAALYAQLLVRVPSPVVALNRAVAVSRAEGPAAGLLLLDELADEPNLARYPLLPAARADLLQQLGRLEQARTEFERAAALTQNARQRARLLERARALEAGKPDGPEPPIEETRLPRRPGPS
jgi:RNA polymerase sigma factor (sigma-70 family)